MPETPVHPALRADARRNRDALLLAARTVFAEEGLDAPLDAIAKRAGVGRATLYRRFPTREDLIVAIFEEDFSDLEAVAAAQVDPSHAFLELLAATIELQTTNLGFIELFTRREIAPEILTVNALRFHRVISGSLQAAQDAGLVRPDLTSEEVGTIILMIGAATANLQKLPNGEERRRRIINLIHDAIDPSRAPRDLNGPVF